MMRFICIAFALHLFGGGSVLAQSSLGDYGVTGLVDMPTARMQDDGTFGFTYARQDVADTFALTYQATPWLETSFRYHIQSPREERWDHYDRSYEVKARLLEESAGLPQLSVGIRDLLGTGVYSAEYLVGSKEFGNLDVTLGLGWGRLAGKSIGRNPLTYISDSFNQRDAETGLGGKLRGGDYFSGSDVGLFGGVQYALPDWKLSLLAEYNSDTYARERLNNNSIEVKSPWGFGLSWEPAKDVFVGLSWQHGSEVGLRLTSRLDSSAILPRDRGTLVATIDGDFPANYAEQQAPEWYNRLLFDAAQAGLWLDGASLIGNDQVILKYKNYKYQLQTDAAERMLMLAELHLPPEIRNVTLVYVEDNLRPFSIQYRRRDWDNIYALANGGAEIRNSMTFLPTPESWEPDVRTRQAFEINTFAGIKPRFSFFDPDNPARYQVYLDLGAHSELGHGWAIQGGVAINLASNFDEITRQSNSVLPHVRSDVAEYLKEGTGLQYLYMDKYGQTGQEIFYRGFAGYLEEMYAGVGAEVLYRPFRSRWALGLNAIRVRQRDYDKRLDFLDYQTTIGHLSLYWASPFYNYDVALHFGRYLAGDWGQTVEVKRRFANGWEVSAFATFTDVSSEDFGEGSFDKGITIRIPLSALTNRESRGSAMNTTIRSITRDGGQRLEPFGTSLWDTLRTSNYDEITLPERLNH